MTQKQLKNKLKKITFNPDDVDDSYFKDYWGETAGKKDDIKDGIKKLTDASTQMSDGLNKLSENNETLQMRTFPAPRLRKGYVRSVKVHGSH